MARVNMLQLKEDPPNIARMYWAVGLDGTEYYKRIELKPGEVVCGHCEGSGRDPVYEMSCWRCHGDGTYITEESNDD